MALKKKLIEVALPLEAINRESAREKSIRHGHPSTLHLWWARRPLAACRAVLFASLVDDPSSLPEEFPTEEAQEKERQRLFGIIEELVKWENSNNEEVLDRARKEILRSTDGNPPPVLDPFCGGGSIPLEAQRLGLEAHGSDLNPVAVLITKALIEIPPKFANRPPVNPEAKKKLTHSAKWKAAQGLADDVRCYGKWIRDEAERRIGHLYPKVKLAGGGEATAIAWLWARTVTCPNPACGFESPLIRSFFLSTKRGKEAWVRPRIDRKARRVWFDVETAASHTLDAESADRGAAHVNDLGKKTKAKFRCVACETATIDGEYVDHEADAGRMSAIPLAIVGEGERKRIYRAAVDEPLQLQAIDAANEYASRPEVASKFPDEPARGTFAGNAQGRIYGFKKFADYFTPRQLVALTTFSDLVGEARERVLCDAKKAMSDDGVSLADGGAGATAYADAVATYSAFIVDRSVDRTSTICTWDSSPKMEALRNTFARQAIPMTWDFAEGNPFSESSGNWNNNVEWVARVLDLTPGGLPGSAQQLDATAIRPREPLLVSTDPPYYDNIGYADLSDFFYVWLRRSLGGVYPQLFSTLLVPKSQELIASPYRHEGSKARAKEFFEAGLRNVFGHIRDMQDNRFPLTIYYAFKQSEDEEESVASTGWETMLEAVTGAGLAVNGTWPVRSELSNRMVGSGRNALASSIVLVCRPRSDSAAIATRREFIGALKADLPDALKKLQHSSIAAVDLAQAAIGPGMAVFSRYAKVIEADGTPMRVRSALQLINQALDEVLSEQESEYDADTQWAVAWFDQFGTSEAPFGEAETLSKAKNTSVGGLVESGLLRAAKGRVQLIGREQLDADWDPATDKRLTIWEVAQHMIRRLKSGGEQAAADLLRKVGGMGEMARDLAYRLYDVWERKGWAEEAIAYNSLVVAWPEISRLAADSSSTPAAAQGTMLKE
jgi:putative DNA methylase